MSAAFHTSCNEAYLPGLKVLIKGIRRTLPCVDIFVTSRDLKQVEGCTIIHPAPILSDIPEYGRWNRAVWDYMNAAALTDYQRIIMVGCDQLIVGDISEMLDMMPEFGALVEHGTTGPKPYKNKFNAFCTGSMIITPGNLKELVSIAKECQWPLAEQSVWNEWAFRNGVKVKEFPSYYDVTKRLFVANKPLWNSLKDKALSVHFVGAHKPWMEGNEKGYENLNNVWRDHANGKTTPLPLT